MTALLNRRGSGKGEKITSSPVKKQGRPLLLGPSTSQIYFESERS